MSVLQIHTHVYVGTCVMHDIYNCAHIAPHIQMCLLILSYVLLIHTQGYPYAKDKVVVQEAHIDI